MTKWSSVDDRVVVVYVNMYVQFKHVSICVLKQQQKQKKNTIQKTNGHKNEHESKKQNKTKS